MTAYGALKCPIIVRLDTTIVGIPLKRNTLTAVINGWISAPQRWEALGRVIETRDAHRGIFSKSY